MAKLEFDDYSAALRQANRWITDGGLDSEQFNVLPFNIEFEINGETRTLVNCKGRLKMCLWELSASKLRGSELGDNEKELVVLSRVIQKYMKMQRQELLGNGDNESELTTIIAMPIELDGRQSYLAPVIWHAIKQVRIWQDNGILAALPKVLELADSEGEYQRHNTATAALEMVELLTRVNAKPNAKNEHILLEIVGDINLYLKDNPIEAMAASGKPVQVEESKTINASLLKSTLESLLPYFNFMLNTTNICIIDFGNGHGTAQPIKFIQYYLTQLENASNQLLTDLAWKVDAITRYVGVEELVV